MYTFNLNIISLLIHLFIFNENMILYRKHSFLNK
jgi:hypothetical protein